jgi:hypothetical protein
MHHNEKALAGATNTDQVNDNLPTGLSTIDSTPRPRVNPKTGKPKHRTWHINAGETSDGRAKGICGWVSRPAPLIASSNNFPTEPNIIPVKCPDCAAIVEMQRDAVNRRARAEKLTEFILDALDKKGL